MDKTKNKFQTTVEVYTLPKKLVVFLLVIFSITTGFSKEDKKTQEKVDYIKIASVLIKDGYYERAIKILNKVDLNQKGIKKDKYYLLKGYAYYNLKDYKNAVKNFKKAYRLSKNNKKFLILYIIDSYTKLQDCKNIIKWIDIGKDYTLKEPKFYLLKINCLKKLKDYKTLLNVLDEAIKKFPNNLQFYRIKFYTFMELKLYASALDTAKKILSLKNVDVRDYIAIAKAMLSSKEYDKAIYILEKANLIYPNNEKVLVALANAYYKKGNILVAAQIFEQAALLNPKYYKDAAELYRKAKDYYHALYLNSKIPDLREKLKQKIAILLDMKRYDQIVSMEELLKMTGLLDEDIIKYAFAYAAFMTKNYEKAKKYFKSINDNQLFVKATQVLSLIEKCQKNENMCY